MKHKVFLLFQLFLLIFALYALLTFSGNMRFLVSLAALIGMFVLGKIETIVRNRSTQAEQVKESEEKDEPKTTAEALDCVLKSKNVLLLTDAIHRVLQDLGLSVSPSPEFPAIDRLAVVPGSGVTFGLKVLGDVDELNENWDQWDELSQFDLGAGGNRRVLIIGSNCMKDSEGGEQKFRNFSASAQSLLSARHMVAITGLTLYKIYLLCKKKKVDLQTIFSPLQRHPGGVFKVDHLIKQSTTQ
jgi:hypothetical protein